MSQQSRRITPGSTYTVQAGDTLWDIAQRAYNDPEDWDTIYDANKHVIGNDPNLIKPGQVLQIPSQSDPDKRRPAPPTMPRPPPTMPTPPPCEEIALQISLAMSQLQTLQIQGAHANISNAQIQQQLNEVAE
jgi:LysM domain